MSLQESSPSTESDMTSSTTTTICDEKPVDASNTSDPESSPALLQTERTEEQSTNTDEPPATPGPVDSFDPDDAPVDSPDRDVAPVDQRRKSLVDNSVPKVNDSTGDGATTIWNTADLEQERVRKMKMRRKHQHERQTAIRQERRQRAWDQANSAKASDFKTNHKGSVPQQSNRVEKSDKISNGRPIRPLKYSNKASATHPASRPTESPKTGRHGDIPTSSSQVSLLNYDDVGEENEKLAVPTISTSNATLSNDPSVNDHILKTASFIWIICRHTGKIRPAYVLWRTGNGAYILNGATFGGEGPKGGRMKMTRIAILDHDSFQESTERPLHLVLSSGFKVRDSSSLTLQLDYIDRTDQMSPLKGAIDKVGQVVLNRSVMEGYLSDELAAKWRYHEMDEHFKSIQMNWANKNTIADALNLNAQAIRYARKAVFEKRTPSRYPEASIVLSLPEPKAALQPKVSIEPTCGTVPSVPEFSSQLLGYQGSSQSSSKSTVGTQFHGSVVPSGSASSLFKPNLPSIRSDSSETLRFSDIAQPKSDLGSYRASMLAELEWQGGKREREDDDQSPNRKQQRCR